MQPVPRREFHYMRHVQSKDASKDENTTLSLSLSLSLVRRAARELGAV